MEELGVYQFNFEQNDNHMYNERLELKLYDSLDQSDIIFD